MSKRGWKREPARHSLASRGVKTRRKLHKGARRFRKPMPNNVFERWIDLKIEVGRHDASLDYDGGETEIEPGVGYASPDEERKFKQWKEYPKTAGYRRGESARKSLENIERTYYLTESQRDEWKEFEEEARLYRKGGMGSVYGV